MAEKIIKVNGKDIKFKATAGTPRVYRNITGSDMMLDMQKLYSNMQNKTEGEEFDIASLEIFENIGYAMAKHADPNIEEISEWLDQFGTMQFYELLPQIFELWTLNNKTNITTIPKKKMM